MSGRVLTIVAVLATFGLIGGLVYYGSQPDYRVLFTDLKPADAEAIIDKLKAANVPYSVTNGGSAIQVPAERVNELRIQMAGDGALSGGHVGFDLFDKTNFGATDFAQQVNYRRAIEGELAKTLEGMDEIESARVHVTPKKESIFADKEEGAKASVVVRVRQNHELSNERTEAIVNLVSSSLEGLDPSSVSVMDTHGRLLVAAGSDKRGAAGESGAFQAQLEAKQKFEAETATRVMALLEPVVGENRVRTDVAADIDFSQTEQSEEKYNPQSQVVRSQQSSQEARNSAPASPAGVAGARSNNPVTQPSPAPTTATTATTATGDSRTTSTVNYEIDKVVKKTIGGGGRVNRLNVSVVVDNKMVNGAETPRTPDELKQIQELVGAAVGIDANRGDAVVVQTMPFSKPEPEDPSTVSFFEKNRAVISSAPKYAALVLAALLVLIFIVRPARKALKLAAARAEEGRELAESVGEPNAPRMIADGSYPDRPMMTVAEMEEQMHSGNLKPERIDQIKKKIAAQSVEDTEMVVSTMRGWLREGN